MTATSIHDNLRLNSALELAGVGVWQLNLFDESFWMSEIFQSHFEFAGDNIISYQNMLSLIHFEDRENMERSMQNALHAGSHGNIDIEIRTQAGHLGAICWLNWKGQVYLSDDGSPSHFFGIVQNVTNTVNGRDIEEQQHSRHLELENLNQELAVINEEYTAANEELAKANTLLSK